jgi:hypothetical protein
MVTFTEIAHAIQTNTGRDFGVQSCIPRHQSEIERFSLIETHVAKEEPFSKIGLRRTPKESEIAPTPVPTPTLKKIVPKQSPVESEQIPTPVSIFKAEPKVEPKPERKQESRFESRGRPQDPICIAISQRDPMYEIASPLVKQSIETEEARIIEGKLADLYKSESGRSRGWTKSHLETFIQPRVASGGSLNSKQHFSWDKLFTDKQTSAELDFICLAKGIRLAVWNDAEKCIGIWPAADLSESKQTPPLFHVSNKGIPLSKTTVFEAGWTLRAALSVEHGLEKLSIDELDSFAEKMGIELSGKKSERVRTLAAARTKQRLQ